MEEGRGDGDFLIGTDIIHFSAMDMGCSWKGPEGDYEKKKKKERRNKKAEVCVCGWVGVCVRVSASECV